MEEGRGTTDAILLVRTAVEKCYVYQQPLCIAFVDYTKAFDSVSHEELWTAMHQLGFDPHLIRLLQGLYRKSLGAVRVNGMLIPSILICQY